MSLFQLGSFVLASGRKSAWKIDCDALTPDDWEALALMASSLLPRFGCVEGVPRGGLAFAAALDRYCTPDVPPDEKGFGGYHYPLLIAEDVVTTGGSMERHRAGRDAIGIAVFRRGIVVPAWVTPIFTIT